MKNKDLQEFLKQHPDDMDGVSILLPVGNYGLNRHIPVGPTNDSDKPRRRQQWGKKLVTPASYLLA